MVIEMATTTGMLLYIEATHGPSRTQIILLECLVMVIIILPLKGFAKRTILWICMLLMCRSLYHEMLVDQV